MVEQKKLKKNSPRKTQVQPAKKQQDKTWLGFIAVIGVIFTAVAVLYTIPSKDTTLDAGSPVCSRIGNYCLIGNVKAVSKEPDGSMVMTVAVVLTDSQGDTHEAEPSFKLKRFNKNISVGNGVLMNGDEKDNTVALTVQEDTNLLFQIFLRSLGATKGPSAIVDMDTFEEMDQD